MGNGGYEGGPALFNLFALVQAAQGAGGGRPWTYTARHTGGTVGGDGQGFLFYSDKDTSWST